MTEAIRVELLGPALVITNYEHYVVMLAVQIIFILIGTEEITQPTLNYAAQLLQHLHSLRLGDHKQVASSIPMPILRTCSAT